MDRMDQLVEDIGELKISVAEISTTVKMGFSQHAEQLAAQAKQLESLAEKTDLALLPIKVAKALVAFAGGMSVVAGFIYGLYQYLVPVLAASTLP